jgi:hypothetical protein
VIVSFSFTITQSFSHRPSRPLAIEVVWSFNRPSFTSVSWIDGPIWPALPRTREFGRGNWRRCTSSEIRWGIRWFCWSAWDGKGSLVDCKHVKVQRSEPDIGCVANRHQREPSNLARGSENLHPLTPGRRGSPCQVGIAAVLRYRIRRS